MASVLTSIMGNVKMRFSSKLLKLSLDIWGFERAIKSPNFQEIRNTFLT